MTVAAKLGSLSRTLRVPVVVVLLEFDGEEPPTDPLIPRAVRDQGLLWFDTRSAFSGCRARDLWIHPLDPHPDARAHAIFADAVESFLREQTLLPE